MGFLTPAMFALLPLVAILISFYLFKQTFEEKGLSTTFLWEEAIKNWEANQWRNKLQRNLLMLLQLIIILFIIFALTHPYFEKEGLPKQSYVLVLDTSASMAVTTDQISRFDEVKKEMKTFISQLTADQEITLIIANQTPVIPFVRTNDFNKVSSFLDEVEISNQYSNLFDSLQLAEGMLGNQEGEIHLYTDSYAIEEDSIKKTAVIHNMNEVITNYSIVSFGVQQSKEQKLINAAVTVKNYADQQKVLTVMIKDNKEEFATKSIEVKSKQEATLLFKNLPVKSFYQAHLLEHDQYNLDNVTYTLLDNEEMPVVYAIGDVNPFYLKALRSSKLPVIHLTAGEKPDLNTPHIFFISHIREEDWPKGPKMIVNPSRGGSFQIGTKQPLNDPLTKVVEDPLLKFVDIEKVYVRDAFKIGNIDKLQPIVKSGDDLILAKGTYQGDPIVLAPFALEDTDFPLHPGFPIFMKNVFSSLYSGSYGPIGYLLPQEQKSIQIHPGAESVLVKDLNGKLVEASITGNVLHAPKEPGLYVVEEWVADNKNIRYVEVEVDQRESEFSKEASVVHNQTPNGNRDSFKIVKQDIWKWLVVVALLIIFIEWEVYRHRNTIR